MSTCLICLADNVVVSTVSVEAAEFGLPSGRIDGVDRIECQECGEVSFSIPAHGAVMKEYRLRLSQVNRRLTTSEFAYLRRSLRMSGRDYASMLDITNVTVSRLENGAPISSVQDNLVRALTMIDVLDRHALQWFSERLEQEVVIDVRAVDKGRTRDLTNGWRQMPVESLPNNVVPMRRLSTRRHEMVVKTFSASIEQVTAEPGIERPEFVGQWACR